jgi:twitching motility two-component system response regulator PilH
MNTVSVIDHPMTITAERAIETAPSVIAIVEDQAAIAELLHDILDDAGYLPVVVTEPEAALETIKRTGAEIVLLDIMMPRRNGWEVLDDLRADSATREVPVVLTSAVYDRIGRRPLPIGGPIRFAAKPFDMSDLLGTIESLIESHVRGTGGDLSD